MDVINSNGSASFSYTGTGSTALGLVGSMTGTGHVGSQSYQYDQKNWLSSFTDASKTPSPSFGYTYSSAKELTYLDYPGNLQMRQIWNGKNITSQVYQNTLTQTTYASIYQSYTSDKLTGYTYNIKAGMTNFSDTVTPSYVSTGTMKEKLDTLTYSGSGRVITYGYDANHGRLNSLKYSDIDPNTPFSLNYDSAGRLTSIVDPNSQTISTYSYDANNQGLLSSIAYTGNKSATFTWNAKKQITNYVYTDNSTQPATTKAWEITYYDDGRVATHTYSLNDTYQYDWKYYYSPYGIDKALKYNSGQLLITIDATTAPNGRMLSLYYQDHTCQTNCFQGEASAVYDPCGNMISLVANSSGAEVWARAIDKNSDSTIGIYNPYNMEIPFSAQATINPSYDQPINGPIEFHIPEQGQLDLKELLANMTRVNTTIGENGVDASSSGDDDCGEDECDPCAPENMFPEGENSSYSGWWYELNRNYNARWKDTTDCETLKGEWTTQHNVWKRAKNVAGFTGEYSDYEPGSDFDYAWSICKYVDTSMSRAPGSDAEKLMWAFERQDYRRAIAGLQVLDCLMAKLGCE